MKKVRRGTPDPPPQLRTPRGGQGHRAATLTAAKVSIIYIRRRRWCQNVRRLCSQIHGLQGTVDASKAASRTVVLLDCGQPENDATNAGPNFITMRRSAREVLKSWWRCCIACSRRRAGELQYKERGPKHSQKALLAVLPLCPRFRKVAP